MSEMDVVRSAGAYEIAPVVLVEKLHSDDFLVELQGRLRVLHSGSSDANCQYSSDQAAAI
jgi:hypothetical protein